MAASQLTPHLAGLHIISGYLPTLSNCLLLHRNNLTINSNITPRHYVATVEQVVSVF